MLTFQHVLQLGGPKQCRTGSGAGKVPSVSEVEPESTPETTPIRKPHSTTPELRPYNSGKTYSTTPELKSYNSCSGNSNTPELKSYKSNSTTPNLKSYKSNSGGQQHTKALPIRVNLTAEERERAAESVRHSPLLPSLRFCAERALPFGANGGQSPAGKRLEQSVEDDEFSVCTLGKEEALAHSACKLAKSQKYKPAQTNEAHGQARKPYFFFNTERRNKKKYGKRDSSDDSPRKHPCATHSQAQDKHASPGSKHLSPDRRTGLSGASGIDMEEDLDVPLKQRRAGRSGEGAAPAAGDEMEEDLDVPLKQRRAASSGAEVVDSTREGHRRNAAATAKESIAGILKIASSGENEHSGNGDDEASSPVKLGEAEEDDDDKEDMKWRDEGQEYIGKRVRRTIWGVEKNAPVMTGSADAQVLSWLPAGESVRALHTYTPTYPPTHTHTNTLIMLVLP